MRSFGLIGKPLTHSFSKRYFAEKFERESISDASYELFELATIDRLPLLLRERPDLRGLNVTIPYKEAVLPYLAKSHIPKELGACNCIRIEEGRCVGYNTDWVAFERSLRPLLEPRYRAALVLGTGGASLAVTYVLRKLGIPFTQVGRAFSAKATVTYAQLSAADMQAHQLIINTTPLGTYPDTESLPELPYQALGAGHLLYDLVYNPAVTSLLQQGIKAGARIKNGEEMLQLQAEESWKIWNA
ncbi:MAG: shikimate dehydrogenase family protein [Sphingomonadales bacterium]